GVAARSRPDRGSHSESQQPGRQPAADRFAAVRNAMMETVLQDLRYAVRTLRKTPAFTIVASLTLAVGIGATSAIYSLVSAVILRSLPVRNPGELVLVRSGGQYPVFQAYQSQTDIFADLIATSGINSLDVEVQPGIRERADVSLVSGSFFSTLG